MKITGIVWLEEVVDKLQRKHGVEPDEVEEALTQKARIRRIEAGQVQGEDLYAGVGRTVAGRHLIVFFVYKRTREALIVSARDATGSEKKLYGKK
jgi:uncharacterized protein